MQMKGIRRKSIRLLVDSSDPLELNDMAIAVVKRYSQLFADEEVVFLSLPRHDTEERRRIISAVLAFEQAHP